MNHPVLARKWRPKNFEEVVGQTHVLQSLTNSLKQGKLQHSAYLFTGTRGIGKTTLGRILAKSLSCKSGITATPCNQCDHCTGINEGKFPDFFEIDAASHTKIEDTRTLLSNVPYAPVQGPFKIYLIDEVHMLSTHSFNALLKTLEEPPEHVIFILATTDPEKLPATIISRCLQFHLKSLTIEQIESHLKSILEKENIPFEADALLPVAHAAKGSLRDALTLLHQSIAYSNAGESKPINAKDVCALLGTIDTDYLIQILEAIHQKNGDQIATLTQTLSEKAIDFENFLQSLTSLVHRLTLIKIAPNAVQSLSEKVKQLATLFSLSTLQKFYQILTSGQQDLSLSPTPKMGIDMVLIRMLAIGFVQQKQKEMPAQSQATTQPAPIATPKPIPANPPKTEFAPPPPPPKENTGIENPPKAPKSNTRKPESKIPDDDHIKAIMEAFNAKLVEN